MKTSTVGAAVHPGVILRRQIRRMDVSIKQAAMMLGLSRQALYDIFDARRRLTAGVALRVGRLTGTCPRTWLNLQQDYDLVLERRSLGARLQEIPKLEEDW